MAAASGVPCMQLSMWRLISVADSMSARVYGAVCSFTSCICEWWVCVSKCINLMRVCCRRPRAYAAVYEEIMSAIHRRSSKMVRVYSCSWLKFCSLHLPFALACNCVV